MAEKIKELYLGAAYYPEDWDESEQEKDIAKMLEAGINVARMGEFAWSKMEPHPGEYDFTWLHNIVDKLKANGIKVVLGTPTPTPPIWLSKMHPDVMYQMVGGRQRTHGGRRHCCSNNPHYREYSAKIAEKMVQEFGKDENVIGWQIDNEIYIHDGGGCFCEHCQKGFREYLKERYGTIENLNKQWNLNIFSQNYESFDDIPAPRDAWHQPHIRLEWFEFQAKSQIDFVHMQAEILHKYTDAPIGTDTMPFNGMDYKEMNSKLDVVQFNHYNEQDNLWKAALWFDYLRNLLPNPFWVTETSPTWNGHHNIVNGLKPEGFCVVNSYMPIAMGGEANMYWVWRNHWAGHEMTHGAVLEASGRPQLAFGEIKKTAELMKKTTEFIRDTKIKTKVGFHYCPGRVGNMFLMQKVCDKLPVGNVWDNAVYDFYKPLNDLGVRPDLIDFAADLSGYDMICTTMALTLEQNDFQKRICEWVKNGGTWVVGPFTDIRNYVGARYTDRPFGILEELTGAKWLYNVPDDLNLIKVKDANGNDFETSLWYDVFDAEPENTLATIQNGHSGIAGKACIVEYAVGKGKVIIIGTLPKEKEMKAIFSRALDNAGIAYGGVEGDLIVCPRKGENTEGVILLEHTGLKGAKYSFQGELYDVVTGEKYVGSVKIEPNGVKVLEKR